MLRKLFCKHQYKFINEMRSGGGSIFDFNFFAKQWKHQCKKCNKIKWLPDIIDK